MIRAAFVELVGEKKNMETITVGELAEHADIAKSTFYNHYDDVYAVAEEFENELIAKLSVVLDEIELERSSEYESYFRKVIEFLKVNEDNICRDGRRSSGHHESQRGKRDNQNRFFSPSALNKVFSLPCKKDHLDQTCDFASVRSVGDFYSHPECKCLLTSGRVYAIISMK